MPKPNYAHIAFLLDRSGSMDVIASDTIGGFNAFLASQRTEASGRVTVSLAQFDDQSYDVLYGMVNIHAAPNLSHETFRPRGGTPLTDSIARIIDETGASLRAMPEHERPSQVFVVILTDGLENASTQTVMNRNELRSPGYWMNGLWITTTALPSDHRRVVSEMIAHQREKYGWQFVFLGANQDAISTGAKLGISQGASLTYAYTGAGVNACYAVASAAVARSRTTGQSVCFSQEERDAALGSTTDTSNTTSAGA